MILRRITAHLKAQDWTAIAIDFVIVVIGVFVGIQVSNWNSERQADAQERELLLRLRTELDQDILSARQKMGFFDIVRASAERTYAYIDGNPVCTAGCWKQLVDAFYASQWRDVRPPRRTIDELERLGMPRDLQLRRILVEYYDVHVALAAPMTAQPPEFRTLVRSIIPPQVQTHLWRHCHRMQGQVESLATDCPEALDDDGSRAVMERIRAHPGLHESLVYWMSTLAALQPMLEQQIADAAPLTAAIDARLRD